MLKNAGQSYSIKKALKQKSKREFINLDKAKTAGILISNLKNDHKSLELLTKALKEKGLKTTVLSFLKDKEVFNYNLSNVPFSNKDINWLGQIKSQEIKNFINSPFDYLICLNTSPFLPFENILAHSKAKCRVGIQHSENSNCYEVSIGLSDVNNSIKLPSEIMKYLEMIKTN